MSSENRSKSPSTTVRKIEKQPAESKKEKLSTMNDYDSINKDLDEINRNAGSSPYRGTVRESAESRDKDNREIKELRNDMKELLSTVKREVNRVENLEYENKQIKEENKNLFDFKNLPINHNFSNNFSRKEQNYNMSNLSKFDVKFFLNV